PCHWFENDEVVAFASERAPLCTGFEVDASEVNEVEPGCAVLIKKSGLVRVERIRTALTKTQCTFERIYFSRGNDADIYRERKALGAGLADQIWSSVKGNLQNSIFSFIPNTAEVAYFGLMSELRFRRRAEVKQTLLDAAKAGE